MARKYLTQVNPGDVLEELGPKLVLDVLDSWDGGVMLVWLDLETGKKENSFYGAWDQVTDAP